MISIKIVLFLLGLLSMSTSLMHVHQLKDVVGVHIFWFQVLRQKCQILMESHQN